jgi:hypothetical protein
MYDPYSPESWDIEGHGTVYVDDVFFDDSQLKWMCLNEITLEPVTGDPMETRLEPVFWLYNKDLTCELQLSESEMIHCFTPYLGD